MACEQAGIAVAFGGAGIRELNIANRSVEHAAVLPNKLRGVGMEKVVVHPLDALDEASWRRRSSSTLRLSG